MRLLTRVTLAAAMLGGVALTAMPADAGVVVGVGVGGPAHTRHWCWRHPGACRHPGYIAVAAPRIGVFYTGRGWWDGHRYWAHRERWHGHWRYR
jgi:hypothetical protein